MCRTTFPGDYGAIQSRRTATDNGHAPGKVIDRGVWKQVHHFGAQVLILDTKFNGFPQPGGDADSVVTLI